jgi:protein required for attachment to host cells
MTPSPYAARKTCLVVVANESRAIFYARESANAPLRQLRQLDNTVARKKMADLITDHGGRSFDSHGHGRHTMTQEKSDPKKHAAQLFAKLVSDEVTDTMTAGAYEEFALIAAPKFLGMLRDALPASMAAPSLSIDKDVVNQDAESIASLLSKNT